MIIMNCFTKNDCASIDQHLYSNLMDSKQRKEEKRKEEKRGKRKEERNKKLVDQNSLSKILP